MNKTLQGLFVFLLKSVCFYSKDFFSSTDSDSDPEGGELPNVFYPRERQALKKKVKKRRSQKSIDERLQKLNQKRQVNIFRNIIQCSSHIFLQLILINITRTLRLIIQKLTDHHRINW
jgi:hypothetical protein